MTAPRRRARRSGPWWTVAAFLLAVIAGSAGLGQPAPDPPPAVPDRPTREVARSEPVALTIAAIGVAVRLAPLGLNPDGTVEVPSDYDLAGWYRWGPTPGQVGSAVILGHVDSYRAPAVFFRLRQLRAGDRVDVGLAGGATVHFMVYLVQTYPKERFPAERVYGSHGDRALQLVTCGGTFDPDTRSYRSNVVVYTRLVDAPPAA